MMEADKQLFGCTSRSQIDDGRMRTANGTNRQSVATHTCTHMHLIGAPVDLPAMRPRPPTEADFNPVERLAYSQSHSAKTTHYAKMHILVSQIQIAGTGESCADGVVTGNE